MILEVSAHAFTEIIKKGYSLDLIFLLNLVKDEKDLTDFCKESVKLQTLHHTLMRKQLIIDDKISANGLELLSFLTSTGGIKLIKSRPKVDDFKKWWDSYPSTDTFSYKNQNFTGSRSLKANKDKCKEKLESILLEKEFTIDEMVAALEYEVLQKKENSLKTKQNKLSYMQNSYTYLNQKTYESYIEIVRTKVPVKETNFQTTETFI